MAALGWIVFIFGGAWLAASLAFAVRCMGGGGLEAVASGLYIAGIAAIAWFAFAVWLSPITLGWGA
jgi:hypothetical protein